MFIAETRYMGASFFQDIDEAWLINVTPVDDVMKLPSVTE